MAATLIPASAAAAILGINTAQVHTLIRRDLLTDRTDRTNGAKRNIMVEYTAVVKLKEKYPAPDVLMKTGDQRGGPRPSFSMKTAEVLTRLDAIDAKIDRLLNSSAVVEQNTAAIVDHLTRGK